MRDSPESPKSKEDQPPRLPIAFVIVLLSGIFVLAAVVWLAVMDRSDALPALAIGEFGPFVSLGVGAAVGFTLSFLIWVLSRYLRSFRELEARLFSLVGEQSESEIVAISVSSAVGEEVFFRGALQVFVGPYFAALVFGILYSGPGVFGWGIAVTLMGLLFGVMVDQGLGLLSVTVAHALTNFISLRRMRPA